MISQRQWIIESLSNIRYLAVTGGDIKVIFSGQTGSGIITGKLTIEKNENDGTENFRITSNENWLLFNRDALYCENCVDIKDRKIWITLALVG